MVAATRLPTRATAVEHGGHCRRAAEEAAVGKLEHLMP